MGQDSYRYDQWGLGVRLGSDRSANSAQALEGYPLDVRPDGTWPGLEGSGQLRVRPEAVRELSDLLKERARAAEPLPDRVTRVTSVRFGPATWQEANNLADACRQVRDAVQT